MCAHVFHLNLTFFPANGLADRQPRAVRHSGNHKAKAIEKYPDAEFEPADLHPMDYRFSAPPIEQVCIVFWAPNFSHLFPAICHYYDAIFCHQNLVTKSHNFPLRFIYNINLTSMIHKHISNCSEANCTATNTNSQIQIFPGYGSLHHKPSYVLSE